MIRHRKMLSDESFTVSEDFVTAVEAVVGVASQDGHLEKIRV